MRSFLHRWPSILDPGWVVYCAAPTLREAQRAYVQTRGLGRARWTFWLKWEPA